MKFKILLIILCALGSSCKSQSSPNQKQKDLIPLNSSVRYGKLDNGFTYYIQKNEDPKNSVELRLVVKAGRIHEDEDQMEYAHLLEHLLANKTKNFPNIKNHFTRIGGYSNASTGTRHTTYVARIPSEDTEVVKDGIHLLFDWAQGIQWDPKSIAIQRGAIEGESRGIDPFEEWLRKTSQLEVLKNTGYKIYSTDQKIKNLQNFNPEAFKRYYDDWYRPDLQAVIVLGDINVDSVEYEIKKRFSDIKIVKNPKDALDVLDDYKINLNGSNQFSTVQDSVRQELNLRIVRLRPNFESHPRTRGDYEKMLLQQLHKLLLSEKAEKFMQQYDPPFQNFVTGYGINQIPDNQIDGILLSLKLEPDDLQQMKKQFQNSLIAWKQMHLSLNHVDLENAKTVINKNYTDKNMLSSNFLVRRYEKHFVKGAAAPHPELEEQLISEILSGIELKDIREYVFEHGNLDKNTFFIFFKGNKINMPEYQIFNKWIKEVDSLKIEPYIEEETITSLAKIVNIPSKNLIDSVVIKENEIGISTVELKNGVNIIFKPTSPRTSYFENLISIQAFRPVKAPVKNRQQYFSALAAPQVMQYTGVGNYNLFQLKQFKEEKGITLNFRTNQECQMINASAKSDALPELFSLLYLYFDQPRKDTRGFEKWKMDQKEHLEGIGPRGSANFIMDKITAFWYPELPVMRMEDLEDITQEQVFQAGNQWFNSIENFTFIVTGDFDSEILMPEIINTLAAFPTENSQPLNSRVRLTFPLKKMEEKLEYKNVDQVFVRLFFPVKVPKDIKTQIELELISKALYNRIFSRLRIGTYSPRVSGEWLDFKNGIYGFTINFDSALGNEEVMIQYAMEEFRELREKGVEKEWLKIAIINELRSYESRFDNFGHFNFWPDYLQVKLQQGEDPVSGILYYGTLLEHFTSLEDINGAIKKYMSEEHLQQFTGYPEEYLQVR